MVLRVNGTTPLSMFSAFGAKENTATLALGWVLEHSPGLRRSLLSFMGIDALIDSDWLIELQKHSEDGGFTDIELRAPNLFHVIIEAKRGWILPKEEQFARYVSRLHKSSDEVKALISISAADRTYAARLPRHIDGIRLAHLAWSDVREAVKQAHSVTTSVREKMLLSELDSHLEAYVTVQDPSDNNVYVVSLSDQPTSPNGTYTWIDVVERDRRYFHPFGGKGWPVVPPNYLGFRYRGHFQSVHRVIDFEVVRDVSLVDDRWPKTEQDNFVYRLGPPMRPASPVRTGNIYKNGRVWCAIDTLLSGEFPTISAARDETQRRLGRMGQRSS
jgi:hypothetical protein